MIQQACPHAETLGISARASDGEIRAALQEVVDHSVRSGVIPPERRDHAVGWCLGWLTTLDPALLRPFCVHVQAIGAVAAYPDGVTGEEAVDA